MPDPTMTVRTDTQRLDALAALAEVGDPILIEACVMKWEFQGKWVVRGGNWSDWHDTVREAIDAYLDKARVS